MPRSELLDRLARLTAIADKLTTRGQLDDALREIESAKRRDPTAARQAIAAARDDVRTLRADVERDARARRLAEAPSLDVAEALARTQR